VRRGFGRARRHHRRFRAHNLPPNALSYNNGFEKRLGREHDELGQRDDLSGRDIKFLQPLPRARGQSRSRWTLPPEGFFYSAYALTLFDVNHQVAAHGFPAVRRERHELRRLQRQRLHDDRPDGDR